MATSSRFNAGRLNVHVERIQILYVWKSVLSLFNLIGYRCLTCIQSIKYSSDMLEALFCQLSIGPHCRGNYDDGFNS